MDLLGIDICEREVHKISSYFLQHFNPEGCLQAIQHLDTHFTKTEVTVTTGLFCKEGLQKEERG